MKDAGVTWSKQQIMNIHDDHYFVLKKIVSTSEDFMFFGMMKLIIKLIHTTKLDRYFDLVSVIPH